MFNPNKSPYGYQPRQLNLTSSPFSGEVRSPLGNNIRSPHNSLFTPERYPSGFNQRGPPPGYWSPHGNPTPHGFSPNHSNRSVGDRFNYVPPPSAVTNTPTDFNQPSFYGSPMDPRFQIYHPSGPKGSMDNISPNSSSSFSTLSQDRSFSYSSPSYQACRSSNFSSTPTSNSKQRRPFGHRANFKDSITASLSDPWESLKPRRTPGAGCLVVQPIAQRHTVLFTSRERRRKTEDISKDLNTSEAKRSHNSSDTAPYTQSSLPSALILH